MNDAARAVEAVWRLERPKLVAAVARLVRDLDLAEDLAHDALVAALEHWPREGVPDNPAAWLMATAKHRALDRLRQAALHARKQGELGADADARGDHVVPGVAEAIEAVQASGADTIADDLLRLVFTACHPVLAPDARVALTLKLLCGLSTAEIARAFLAAEPTIAQRIVRAKRALLAAQVPYEVPRTDALPERLDSVLEVVYLVFNEGYAASSGDDWMRPALCDEALRLGRVLTTLLPDDAEVHGLLALMEFHASRAAARVDPQGRPVLLMQQDRRLWDALLIRRAFASLERSQSLAAAHDGLGPYALQASIAACHAGAARAEATDWQHIVRLYDALARSQPSPVIELNRAVAVGMAFGAAAALPLVDALSADAPALSSYHLLPSVRGDLLAKLGRRDEARAEFRRAAALTRNERERALLLERADSIDS